MVQLLRLDADSALPPEPSKVAASVAGDMTRTHGTATSTPALGVFHEVVDRRPIH
jgi:hypothetical protein